MRGGTVVLALGALLAAAFGGACQTVPRIAAAGGTPSFEAVRAAYRPSDARLLDRHGEVLHEVRIDATRRRLAWAPLADISPALPAAVLASEDRRFYDHHGVDVRAVVAAVWQRLTGGRRRGASTITMQTAALIDAAPARSGGTRTVWQKWQQMRAAWAIERQWAKAEILEAYLNLVTFRGELQGVGAAAAVLFGKAPHGITAAEALVLAALVQAPNASPTAVVRRAVVLNRARDGVAPPEEIAAAAEQAVRPMPSGGPRVALAPHAARLLLRAGGCEEDTANVPPEDRTPRPPSMGGKGECRQTSDDRRRSPLRGGEGPGERSAGEGASCRLWASERAVRSTLDAATQRYASETLRRHLLAVRTERVEDGAVLVVDNATGDILAYVGSSGELSAARHVDGVRARRQAGSTLKPLLYALAFDQRLLTPASIVEDTPLEILVAGGVYRPRDYDDRFRGLVSARTALSASLNVPAVRVLQLVGEDVFVQHLRSAGFAGLVEAGDYYGPALALGSGDVTLWELTNAYRALANGGVWQPLRWAREAARAATEERSRRVFSASAAFLVADILADRESRSPTFGLDNALNTRFWTAVKTGTSKEMRDNWCIGFSSRYTVGVWVGNFSGAPMRNVSGVTGAAPVWLEVMQWLHRDMPSAPPQPPEGVQATEVRFPGTLEVGRREWFVAGTAPGNAGVRLATHRAAIVAPVSGSRIVLDPDIPPGSQRVLFRADTDVAGVAFTLNGRPLGSAARPVLWDPEPGVHTLVLTDGRHVPLDHVTFTVRGAATATWP